EPGATYSGPFTLPKKAGADWITVTSAKSDSALPPGRRVDPASAPSMAKLVSGSSAVVAAAPGAHHYRLVGLEIAPRDGVFLKNVVEFGTRPGTLEEVPHHLAIERCYVHGDPREGARRGIALNSADTAVVDSYLSDFKEVGADSQAIAGWAGPGPYKILD